MKKMLMVILSLWVSFAFVGCGATNNSIGIDSNNQAESTGTASSSDDTSSGSADNGLGDSAEDGSDPAPPVTDGENELPLVPVG